MKQNMVLTNQFSTNQLLDVELLVHSYIFFIKQNFGWLAISIIYVYTHVDVGLANTKMT